jgi:NAD(P)-dependent dehydrogenase (short-subunit alcohol dehydrogenase family)
MGEAFLVGILAGSSLILGGVLAFTLPFSRRVLGWRAPPQARVWPVTAPRRAGLIQLTRTPSRVWGGGVRVNAVCPGYVETKMTAALLGWTASARCAGADPARAPQRHAGGGGARRSSCSRTRHGMRGP